MNDADDNGTHGERVKASIIAAGLELWRVDPAKVSARGIGRKIGLTHCAVLYHFPRGALKEAVAAEAVRIGDMVIVPQLIAARHPAAALLTEQERRRYLAGC